MDGWMDVGISLRIAGAGLCMPIRACVGFVHIHTYAYVYTHIYTFAHTPRIHTYTAYPHTNTGQRGAF